MHSKKPLFVALAMCLSFTAILSFMLVLSTPDPRPKRKRTAARQSVVKPTPQKRRQSRTPRQLHIEFPYRKEITHKLSVLLYCHESHNYNCLDGGYGRATFVFIR